MNRNICYRSGMIQSIPRKLGGFKTLNKISATLLFGLLLLVTWKGGFTGATVLLLFLASMYFGIGLGMLFARLINRYIPKETPEIQSRLKNGFSVFGFLFIPPLLASWANTQFDQSIEVYPLWEHFLWASGCSFVAFAANPKKGK